MVGNLWDITSTDIDKFTIALLDGVRSGRPLPRALTAARKACATPYLVGVAPVYYGVPDVQYKQ